MADGKLKIPNRQSIMSYSETQKELSQRHRTAMIVSGAFLLLTLALIGIAFAFSEKLFRPGDNRLSFALWIIILVLGLGTLILQRARFAVSRLKDIAVLRGVSGLLKDMQGSAILMATIGGAVALLGFVITIRTGNENDMLRAGIISLAILLYCYPRKSAWQRAVYWLEKKD
jgi:hypothetical protein